MIRSLFGKILLSHLLVLIITTACIGLLLSQLVPNYLIETKRGELISEGMETALFIDTIRDERTVLPSLLTNLSKLSGATLWLMDTQGRVISGQPPKRWHHRMTMQHMRHGKEAPYKGNLDSWVYRGRNDEDPSIVAAVPLPSDASIALFLHTPIAGISQTSAAIQRLLLYTSVGSIFLAGIFAFFLSRSLTKPIQEISRAAEKFASGDYDTRTKASGADEIGKLGQTFNKMAAALTRIEQNRRDFFSDVTHELKTPIAAIQAVTESLLDGVVTEEKTQKRYLHTVLDETKHMNHLISELLNLAQLESGQLQFHYQTIALDDFLQNQQQKYQLLLSEKRQQLLYSLDPALHCLHADPTRLDQIFANLISNAIRHSPENEAISIEATTEKDWIQFAIIDHGEGIPETELPYLWERFYRVDKSRARNKGGTGLGLSITKKLVEGMGGSIRVESAPGKGTIFYVHLPKEIL